MANIFEGSLLKEFENFYRVIIPSLKECNFCNKKYYSQSTKSNCRIIECKICKTFKRAKTHFVEKCTEEQLKYAIEFFRDYFSVSEFSSKFFNDLVPLTEKIRNRKDIFFLFSENGYVQKLLSI